MDGQEKLLDYETIKAAAAGEKWATEKVLAHYADYIDELSTVEIRQPGGKVKKVIDEDMRQHISLKLLEALPSFPLEQAYRDITGKVTTEDIEAEQICNEEEK